jgi:hypothetical protein
MIPPDSPPFDPLPTPLLPPLLPPIAAINTSISTLAGASISVPSPKKGIKSNTNTITKDGKEKDVKEKDLNYTKDKDKDNIKEKESDINEKERKDFNGEEIYGKDASGITKELMTRQDKITEAFRIRAAAVTSSSTTSSATSSSASLSTSASLSATATSMLIPLGMESDGSGVSTPTKSNIGSRSPNLGPALNTSKLSNASNASNASNVSGREGEVEFKEVRKMPVLVKETSPTSMSPVNTVNTVKMHGVISSNSLGPAMMDSAMQLTPNGLPSAPPGVLMPSIDTTAVIRMARSQSYNEVSPLFSSFSSLCSVSFDIIRRFYSFCYLFFIICYLLFVFYISRMDVYVLYIPCLIIIFLYFIGNCRTPA